MKHTEGMKHKESKEEQNQRLTLTLLVTAVVLAVIIIVLAIVALILFICGKMGIFEEDYPMSGTAVGVVLAIVCFVIGSAITFGLIRFPLAPVNNILSALNSLSSGDYSARLSFGKLAARISAVKAIETGFNKMASELQNTELLRSDFINNFSHEFKTPIVSIAGFAKLLRRGKLTEEQQQEYLTIIEEESLRLSYMATNVLNLTKVENQIILADVEAYNLSEQLRNCVLLLENKWSAKSLEMELDFDEYTVEGNQELLKQVWINLLDNAIKFTDEFGTVKLDVKEKDGKVTASIINAGECIPPEAIPKLFNKFYQADESHASMGNGVGLAVVKKIVDLHNGTVTVQSEGHRTEFAVTLPCKQKGGNS